MCHNNNYMRKGLGVKSETITITWGKGVDVKCAIITLILGKERLPNVH